ncbi:MAG: divalent-cation tolerance protein CutA [Pseudomonadota bacterium]
MDTIIVLTNMPDRAAALALAQLLVEQRAAACVNVLGECSSVYRWQGKIETATEVPVLIKTRQAIYPRLEALIKQQHPYELPEIIAVPLISGLPTYLAWVSSETTHSPS